MALNSALKETIVDTVQGLADLEAFEVVNLAVSPLSINKATGWRSSSARWQKSLAGKSV
ncbi:MAG: hypothetical protein M5U34_03585 [Chloroflexi bacterium]|nr:hypothetical protein [Chloroflexota bacterium]